MGASPATCCVLHNLFQRECRRCRNVNQNTLFDFFQDLGLLLNNRTGRKRSRPTGLTTLGRDWELISDVIKQRPAKYLFQGRRMPTEDVPLVRYIEIKKLCKQYGQKFPDLLDVDDSPEGIRQQIIANKITAANLTVQAGDEWVPSWVTTKDDVDRLLRDANTGHRDRTEADIIRSTLGLVWPDCRDYNVPTTGAYARLEYSRDNVPEQKIIAPTVFEAPHPVFRPRVYVGPLADDGWGRTVNLLDLGDGVREAIHKRVPNFESGFELSVTGYAAHGPVEPSYPALLKVSKAQLVG